MKETKKRGRGRPISTSPAPSKIDHNLALSMRRNGASLSEIVFAHSQLKPPVLVSQQAVARFLHRWLGPS